MLRLAPILLGSLLVAAHGDHSFDLDDINDAGLSYAERHMHTEHHIDSFDLESFFKLHDLDADGFWSIDEVQAVYGLHHHSVKDAIQQPAVRDARTDMIVDRVMLKLDANNDGKISLEEFLAGGMDGLPSFEGYKNLGHHYDEESEYFLHHEELYHSTPETQTDESYNHPEDIQHFKHHAAIEDEEDARERKFEGLANDADLSKDHVAHDPLDVHAHASGEGPSGAAATPQQTLKPGDEVDPRPAGGVHTIERANPAAQPQRIMNGDSARPVWDAAKEAAKAAPGYDGHARPRNAEERLRAGVPYTLIRMRKGLRSDEF
ncbi:hypothetical protein IAU60_000979 [Kwoniella sp. DSM 27419]